MGRSIYQENGHKDREAYLASLSDDHGIDLAIVQTLADVLGPEEDFDGLLMALEDADGLEEDF